MVRSTKTQRLREKVHASLKSGQTTWDNLPATPKKETTTTTEPGLKKQIAVTEIKTETREDELALTVSFKLLPSKKAFSKITSDLFFDGNQLSSRCLSVIQGPLAVDDSEFTCVLDMKGIGAGPHTVTVEMCELWGSEEKLNCTSKEVTIDYVPLRREDRLIKIPIVKSIAGADLEVASQSEKGIYQEMEESTKKEIASKQDKW